MRDFKIYQSEGAELIVRAARGRLELPPGADVWEELILPWIAYQEGEGSATEAAPGDAGGITRYGWAAASWGLDWVRSLTWETAAQAYRERVTAAFPPPEGLQWSPAQQLLLADAWIQHEAAQRLVQRAAVAVLPEGPIDPKLLDGRWGPTTASAVYRAPVARFAWALCRQRLLHVSGLGAKSPGWSKIWIGRYSDCQAVATALAGQTWEGGDGQT